MYNRILHRGFTLIELLVVIAIIAILAVVVVVTLNPAQLLAQSRDANRVSDMATLNSALSLYQIDRGGVGGMGTSSVVYTSFSDTSSTCGNQNLPIVPSGYTYNCTKSTSTRNTNGQGWIPLNFQNISSGAPFGSLPIDPSNTSSSRLYYTYDTNGSLYETTASMESSKYKMGGSSDVISSDGGTLASVYEKGTGLELEPLDYGDKSLVGLWTMDEGTGGTSGVTQAYDYSGNGNTGTWYGTAAGTSGYYSPGKVGPWMGTFNGNTYITSSYASIWSNPFTITMWINPSNLSGYHFIFTLSNSYTSYQTVDIHTNGQTLSFSFNDGDVPSFSSMSTSQWYFIAATYNPSTLTRSLYVNGAFANSYTSGSSLSIPANGPTYIGCRWDGYNFSGLMDDVRIYGRALSAAEIQAMYNAGK
ncbi:MAG: LamG domain-containing protein [Candidatus Pacebacteria bacterium]|nr:LamG domain-containing protein [Candidatus Paceibacterota bacterium]